jgi:hypothetical protein
MFALARHIAIVSAELDVPLAGISTSFAGCCARRTVFSPRVIPMIFGGL